MFLLINYIKFENFKKLGKNKVLFLDFCFFRKPKCGILTGLNEFNCADENEICKDGLGFSLVYMGHLLKFLKRDFFMLHKVMQQGSLRFSEGDFGSF